jgi:hypothetical protein
MSSVSTTSKSGQPRYFVRREGGGYSVQQTPVGLGASSERAGPVPPKLVR